MRLRPAVALVLVSGSTFGLAQLHLARQDPPKVAGGTIVLGDVYRGQLLFGQDCSGCHGLGGKGGGLGPKLVGDPIAITAVKTKIEAGGSVMPAGLVTGQGERDVLAFVATLVAAPAAK